MWCFCFFKLFYFVPVLQMFLVLHLFSQSRPGIGLHKDRGSDWRFWPLDSMSPLFLFGCVVGRLLAPLQVTCSSSLAQQGALGWFFSCLCWCWGRSGVGLPGKSSCSFVAGGVLFVYTLICLTVCFFGE